MFADSPQSSYGKNTNDVAADKTNHENDDLPLIQALESSSFSPAASPTWADEQAHQQMLTVDTFANENVVPRSLYDPVGTRSSPATLAQTPLANSMDVEDASLLEAFASVSYSPFAAMRAENKQTKSPVIFEDKEDEEEVDFDDSATTATDMLKPGDAVNETFEVESIATTENLEVLKPMLSLDDLNHLMMSADCVEEYNAMKRFPSSTRSYFEDDECYVPVQVERVLHASRGVQMERDSKIRRALIEEELGQLIELAQQDKDMDEFEPEAIEALGIAAYRLAYHRKYLDAKTGEDVYIPSVAYTVMDGSLLELASQHYFGKSDEFLVTYAGAIGSAIMKQMKYYHEYNSVEREENHLDSEDLNISNVSEAMGDGPMHQQPVTPINSEQIIRMVWGVSPKASLMKDSTKRFTFQGEAVVEDASKAPRFGARKIAVTSFYILALMGAVVFQMPGPTAIMVPNKTPATTILALTGAAVFQMPGPTAIMVPNETPATTAELEQPKQPIFVQRRASRPKMSPKEDLAKKLKVVGSFWKQRFSASKEQVTKSLKDTGSFFKQQILADLEVHMFEETQEQVASLDQFGGKKTMPNLLFGKENKQLAFDSVEDFEQAITANRAKAKKKLEANKGASRIPDSMMKVFAAESFSWNDNWAN